MKQVVLVNDGIKFEFNFPTSIAEISDDYLKAITNNVKVADNYSLLAIIYRETLGSMVLANKQKRSSMASGVIPVFVKAGKTDNEFINSLTLKDKVIIASSELMQGHQVNVVGNELSISKFWSILEKDKSIASRYNNDYGKEKCCFIEFKLIPNCSLVGYYSNDVIEPETKYFKVTDAVESK